MGIEFARFVKVTHSDDIQAFRRNVKYLVVRTILWNNLSGLPYR